MSAARPHHRVVAGVGGVLAAALLLGGCAADLPTASPDPTASPPGPVLSEDQEADVLAAVSETLQAADAANDPAQLEPRVSGPALKIRSSQLQVAAARGNADFVTPLPTEVQQVVIPTTQTWPRTSYAVSVQPQDLQTPRLMALDQAAPRDVYRLWAWVQLLPGVTLPSFADPGIGSEAVAADDDSLLVTPQDAVAQYADVLTVGGGSSFAQTFADDAFRQTLASNADLQNQALQQASGSFTMQFSTTQDPVHAVRTADGGALVMGSLTSLETFTVEEGGKVAPQTETQKALFGSTEPTNVLKVGYDDVVALYVPPAGSTEQVRLLGYTHVATSTATS